MGAIGRFITELPDDENRTNLLGLLQDTAETGALLGGEQAIASRENPILGTAEALGNIGLILEGKGPAIAQAKAKQTEAQQKAEADNQFSIISQNIQSGKENIFEGVDMGKLTGAQQLTITQRAARDKALSQQREKREQRRQRRESRMQKERRQKKASSQIRQAMKSIRGAIVPATKRRVIERNVAKKITDKTTRKDLETMLRTEFKKQKITGLQAKDFSNIARKILKEFSEAQPGFFNIISDKKSAEDVFVGPTKEEQPQQFTEEQRFIQRTQAIQALQNLEAANLAGGLNEQQAQVLQAASALLTSKDPVKREKAEKALLMLQR